LSLYRLNVLISKIHSALVSTCYFPRLLHRYLCDKKRRPGVSFSLLFAMVLNVDIAHISLAIGGGTRHIKSSAVKQVSLLAISTIMKLVASGLVLCGMHASGMQI